MKCSINVWIQGSCLVILWMLCWFKHVYTIVCMILLDVLNFFLAPKWLVVTLTLVSARPPVSGNNYSCFSSVSRYCLPSAYLHQSPAQDPHWLLSRNPRLREQVSRPPMSSSEYIGELSLTWPPNLHLTFPWPIHNPYLAFIRGF